MCKLDNDNTSLLFIIYPTLFARSPMHLLMRVLIFLLHPYSIVGTRDPHGKGIYRIERCLQILKILISIQQLFVS